MAAALVGSVRYFIYTSSAPIIAGNGASYSRADETAATLALTRKGDMYHVAKALGDQLVLQSNGKNGIMTVCIRPTAMYGDRDGQMMPPVLKIAGTMQRFFWFGDNTNDMDVVYVGNVAKAQVLAAHALLAQSVDASHPRVDGQAFNITDDQPANPWTFFGLMWSAAGDKPIKRAIKLPHSVSKLMALGAEYGTLVLSRGKRRPKVLTIERVEFCIYTRTYSIEKAKKLLGFKPWADQPYSDQVSAVRATVANYMRQHPQQFPISSTWPETPFKLIKNTGIQDFAVGYVNTACKDLVQEMALIHNTIFRAVNAIFFQAKLVETKNREIFDLLRYSSVVFGFIQHHHLCEEHFLFPELEAATHEPGLMHQERAEHKLIDAGLKQLIHYTKTTHVNAYSGEDLRFLIMAIAPDLQKHMDSELDVLLGLRNLTPSVLRGIHAKWLAQAQSGADYHK